MLFVLITTTYGLRMSKVSLDKELVRASVDVEAVYNELLNQTPATRDGRNLTYLCPFHTDERTPNLKATTSDGPSRGSYRCFACGEKGDLFSFWMNVKGVGFQKALKALAERTGLPTNSKSKKRQKASKKAVTCDLNHDFEKWPQDLKRWLEGRGITAESVQRYSLAHALYQSRNHALAIPYGDPHKDGYCKLRFYRDDYLHKFATWPSGRPQRLFGLPIEKDTVLLCEGELDTIRLAQEPTGASVLSVPNGAETFKPEWAEELQGKHVAIIFDRDEAGRKGAERAARMLCGSAASVRIVELPEGFKDVTEYLQGSHDGTDIMLLVKDAPEFEPPRTTEVIQGDEALPSLEELQEIITTELGVYEYSSGVTFSRQSEPAQSQPCWAAF
jgi:DNA primase